MIRIQFYKNDRICTSLDNIFSAGATNIHVQKLTKEVKIDRIKIQRRKRMVFKGVFEHRLSFVEFFLRGNGVFAVSAI